MIVTVLDYPLRVPLRSAWESAGGDLPGRPEQPSASRSVHGVSKHAGIAPALVVSGVSLFRISTISLPIGSQAIYEQNARDWTEKYAMDHEKRVRDLKQSLAEADSNAAKLKSTGSA